MRRAEADLHDALATYGQRVVDHHGQRLEFASVVRPTPKLVVELLEGQEQLTEDEELILPRSLRQDARDLDGGDDPDTVVVALMDDGRYLVTNLISDSDAPDRLDASALTPITSHLSTVDTHLGAIDTHLGALDSGDVSLDARLDVIEALSAGSRLTALEAAIRPHAFTARGSGTPSAIAASDVATKYPFGTEDFDSDGDYDAGNTRYVAPTNGWYAFTAAIGLGTPGAVGTRWMMWLSVGGAQTRLLAIEWTGSTWGNDYTMRGTSGPIRLTAGDLVTILLRQNTAGALNSGSAASYFTGSRVGLA